MRSDSKQMNEII